MNLAHRIICHLFAFAMVATGAAANALDAAKVADITMAADAFAALAAGSAKTGLPPRQADPAAKPLLDLVFDTTELKTGPANPISALNPLNDWSRAILKVGQVYMLAGTGIADISAVTGDAKTAERLSHNTAEFSQEAGRYLDAQVWVWTAISETLADFVATASTDRLEDPGVKNMLSQIRSSVMHTVHGDITTLPIEGLSDAWRADRISVLVAIGPKIHRFIGPDNLAALRDIATKVADQMKDPKVKAGLASFAATLAPR